MSEYKYKVVENRITQVKHLKNILKQSTWVNVLYLLSTTAFIMNTIRIFIDFGVKPFFNLL